MFYGVTVEASEGFAISGVTEFDHATNFMLYPNDTRNETYFLIDTSNKHTPYIVTFTSVTKCGKKNFLNSTTIIESIALNFQDYSSVYCNSLVRTAQIII
jgi:hypothetical protein